MIDIFMLFCFLMKCYKFLKIKSYAVYGMWGGRQKQLHFLGIAIGTSIGIDTYVEVEVELCREDIGGHMPYSF